MANIITKVNYNGDMRRFTVPCGDEAFAIIRSRVASTYEINSSQLRLQYEDSDGDIVSIMSQSDLCEALSMGTSTPRGCVLRLEVSVHDSIVSSLFSSETTADPLDEFVVLDEEDEEGPDEPAPEEITKEVIEEPSTQPSNMDILRWAGAMNTTPASLGTFSRMIHVPTGTELAIRGHTLPNGRLILRASTQKHNVAMGPKGNVSHKGGEGPWAQFVPMSPEGAPEFTALCSHGNHDKGWCLGLDKETKHLTRVGSMGSAVWRLVADGGQPFVAVPPAQWYVDKMAAKEAAKAEKHALKAEKQAAKAAKEAVKAEKIAAKEAAKAEKIAAKEAAKAEKIAAKVEKQATKEAGKAAKSSEVSKMLSTITLAGNCDGRDVSMGWHLAVHGSNKRDELDANGQFTIVSANRSTSSLWHLETGGWVPPGLVSLTMEGNMDGRSIARGWTLIVASTTKPPHKRDNTSAYMCVTKTCDRKGGLFAVEPWASDPSKCLLRYVGNRDNRPDAEGWYLAVHGSSPLDQRDKTSQYVIVTKDAAKASLWDIRPFWGAVPTPAVSLDASGNPKVGFHTAKKAAVPAVVHGLTALLEAGCPTELSEVEAGAALQSLRVALLWLRKKTGLPVSLGDLSNTEALDVVKALRELPSDLPKWLQTALPTPKDAAGRVDAMVSALAKPMVRAWGEEAPEWLAEVQTKADKIAVVTEHKVDSKPAAGALYCSSVPNTEEGRPDSPGFFVAVDAGKLKHREYKSDWIIEPQEDDSVLIISKQTGGILYCSSVTTPMVGGGDFFITVDAGKTPNHDMQDKAKWLFEQQVDGSFRIISKQTGAALYCSSVTNPKVGGGDFFVTAAHDWMDCGHPRDIQNKDLWYLIKQADGSTTILSKQVAINVPSNLALNTFVIDAAAPARASDNFRGASTEWAGHSIMEGPKGFIEYEFEVPEPCSVSVRAQYNAKHARPLTLSINHTTLSEAFANGVTGTWKDASKLQWSESVGPVRVPAGVSVLRLEGAAFFPHLMKIEVCRLRPSGISSTQTNMPPLELPEPPDNKTEPSPKADTKPEPEPDAKHVNGEMSQLLNQLNCMGFGTPRANQHALVAADGNLEVAVDLLLTSDYSSLDEAPPAYHTPTGASE